MKSVLFISLMNGGAWGGSEEFWYRTALWMSAHGYKVSVCCYDWPEKQSRLGELKNAGCRIYLLPNGKGLFKKWAIKKALYAIPFEEYNLVVISQGGWEEILHAPFKKLYQKLPGYVLLNHNYNENAVLAGGKRKLLQQWIAGAQMNLGATQKIFEVIERKFNIVIKKKQTLINPVTFLPDDVPASYPVNEPCKLVMLAELDVARKAQDILITALSSPKWKERNWQLHLYGKGRDMERLEQQITDCGLSAKVFLKGYTDNIRQVLQDCNLLLQCTRIDAMPITVVEAMAMARPCVVSRVGDMPVWVEEGVNGFVCEAVSPEGIDAVLEKSWLQKNNWEAMGKKAFETFTKKYPQPFEAKTADIFKQFM